MAPKDYYVVLGISRSESPQGVRRAFRDLVRKHHPDRAGPGGTPAFRDVVEAYRVLSDPASRRRHDEHLEERDPSEGSGPRPTRPASRPARPVEFDARDLFGAPGSVRPSADALLERLLRNFAARGPAKGEHREPLLCDVALEPVEARYGGVLPIRLPVVSPCPRCHATGAVAGFACRSCDAEGELRTDVVVPLEVPPGVPPGTIIEMPLDTWGIHNLWLRARIGIRR